MWVPNGDEETKRLTALMEQGVLDSGLGEIFDDITDLAAVTCEAPLAMITFVDRDRVWLKSRVGVDKEEVPRELSFCTHGLFEPNIFVVPDAMQDDRFKTNPLVTGEPGIRFYAGVPLRDSGGHPLGMICVMDRQPRKLRPPQEHVLRKLGKLVMHELDSRRHAERVRRLEGDAADLRVVRSMASRLLHELGNAVVPLSTHQQLLAERYDDPDFRRSLDATLSEAVRRVLRLVSQMRHLAQVAEHSSELVSIKDIVEEAYKTAARTPGVRASTLHFEAGDAPIVVRGDFTALTDAFGEIILNALQANPVNPEVSIHCAVQQADSEKPKVVVDVSDNGDGFEPETMQDVTQPFFGTRSVGPGLGLAVAKQVIERHHGSLEIISAQANRENGVRISLPIQDGKH